MAESSAFGGIASCDGGNWSTPVKIGEGDRGRAPVFRFASLTSAGGQTFLVGVDADNLFIPSNPHKAFSAQTLAGHRIPSPTDSQLIVEPLAMFESTGRVQMLWAAPNSHAVSDQGVNWILNIPVPEVWSASFTFADGWTSPQLVYRGDLLWGRALTDRIARGNGMLALAVPRMDSGGSGMILLKKSQDRWESLPVSDFGDAAGVTTAISGQWIVVVMLQPAQDRQPDQNSVFVTRSGDGGKTWSNPVMIQRSGRTPAASPQLRLGADGTLHLVWTQQVGVNRLLLRHVQSSDSGLTWSKADELPLKGGFQNPATAFDSCNRLHVVYDNNTDRTSEPSLDHVVWDGHWAHPNKLFPTIRATGPELAWVENRGMTLVFLGRPINAPARAPYESFVSTFNGLLPRPF